MPAKQLHRVVPASRIRAFLLTLSLATAGLASTSAWAGEVLIGKEPLETADDGNVTKAGRKAAVKEVPSEPGEEVWPVHLWAKVDKAAPGPIYVEFHGTLPDGKPYKVAFRHEHSGFEGGQYVSMDFELEGNYGFNKNKSYKLDLLQFDDKDKAIKLASGEIKLTWTEAEEEEDDDDDDDDDDGDDQTEAQDELDTLGGDGAADGDAPPPVESPTKKKGCSIDTTAPAAPGVLVLIALGAFIRRRRR